ncbi:MAG TPA: lipocalin family protein [bacterium]|nr:lipocalin family protein [bacterium]
MRKKTLLALFCAAVGFGCASSGDLPPLQTVAKLDLNRYLGKWHEIARFDHRFERGCIASTAEYALLPDGRISVKNTCRKEDGTVKDITGTAWVADPADPAKLRVRFFWPFSAAYWVIALDDDYRWAVVGHPDRDYLWILSRTPTMDEEIYQKILALIAAQRYEVGRLKKM